MNFHEWLRHGITRQFIDPPVCGTHDATPVTDEEYDEEVCVPVARLKPPANDEAAA